MFEVIFEHVRVEFAWYVERSNRTAGRRAPDTGLPGKKIPPTHDAHRVDEAWSAAPRVLQANETLDKDLEGVSDLPCPADRFSV